MTTLIVSQIIADAYTEAVCDSGNVDADNALRYCDDIYQELIDEKKLINEDFVKKTSKIDTVVYTNKYSLPVDFEKMSMISIKYSVPTYDARITGSVYSVGDKVSNGGLAYVCGTAHTAGATFSGDSTKRVQIYEEYKPCSPRTVDFDLMQDFNNISENNPVYFYENNDLYIYPRPKVIVKEGIKFDYIPVEPTLTLTTDDTTIKIEPKLRDARVTGTAMKFAGHMRKAELKAELKFDYAEGKQKCIDRWTDRHYNAIGEELPSSLYRYMR